MLKLLLWVPYLRAVILHLLLAAPAHYLLDCTWQSIDKKEHAKSFHLQRSKHNERLRNRQATAWACLQVVKSMQGCRKATTLQKQLIKRWMLCMRSGRWGVNTGEKWSDWHQSSRRASMRPWMSSTLVYARRTQRMSIDAPPPPQDESRRVTQARHLRGLWWDWDVHLSLTILKRYMFIRWLCPCKWRWDGLAITQVEDGSALTKNRCMGWT